MANKKALTTQSLVNSFPPWSNTRNDEQSLGYQFHNVISNRLEHLRKQNIRLGDNLFLPTSIVSDIDVYYELKLPGNFIFSKQENDNSDLLFTPPIVSGIIDNNQFLIEIAEKNNIEEFWYNAIPDRISLGIVSSGQFLQASGFADSMPLELLTNSGVVYIPNQLSVTVSGGQEYIRVDANNIAHRTIVQIEGKTRAGLEVVEEIPFLHDETQKTFHEFKEIAQSGIRVYGTSNLNETFIKVTSAQFNERDYITAYDLAVVNNINKDQMPLFWSIGSGLGTAIQTLDLKKYDIDDVIIRIQGRPFVDKHTILQQELLDSSGVLTVLISDIAVEPRSDNLWIVDSGNLYMYSSDLPYSNNILLEGKNYDAHSIIELSSYYIVLGEQIQLDYVWKRPIQGMVKHRVSVVKPDGTKKSIENGIEVLFHVDSSSWFLGEPKDRQIRPSDIFTLDQRGSWIYSLEVVYADGTKSIDKRIVTVTAKAAKAQFNLNVLGITNQIIGIDFDSEYKMWILDSSGIRYQINRHYDNMIIDFNRKIIYFRENYDQIRVF